MEAPVEMKEFVHKKIQDLQQELCLGEYKIEVEYSNDKQAMHAGISGSAMAVTIDSTYLTALITIYQPAVETWWSAKGQFGVACQLLHELCHIFLDPVVNLFMWDVSASQRDHTRETIERQVCRLVRAFESSMSSDWWR